FDDGPDPVSTPRIMEVLAAHRVRATFFVLGAMLARAPWLATRLTEAGHELGVHGWDHHALPLLGPRRTYRGLARTRDLVGTLTGRRPVWFRPPYGVLTPAALVAAGRLGLTPVLWTAWGRDWTAGATADSVLAQLRRRLADGGTVLLHDSDHAAAPGCWWATLGALPRLLDECARRGWRVGPLDSHLDPAGR
ncbi:MAG TPA: polysaccharide deacetylase family protein, partial [Micromonospora sp.]